MTTQRTHHEDNDQAAYFDWVRVMENINPAYSTIYHIPNGGRRNVREAARLKRQGVRAGVSDIHVPVKIGRRLGLWIELKRTRKPGQRKAEATGEQISWLHRMAHYGHAVAICYGWEQARETTEAYMRGAVVIPHALLIETYRA